MNIEGVAIAWDQDQRVYYSCNIILFTKDVLILCMHRTNITQMEEVRTERINNLRYPCKAPLFIM